MKRCPKCNIDYFDNALEFCLEDGAKLSSLANFDNEIPTLLSSPKTSQPATETVNLPKRDIAKNLESHFINANNANNEIETASQSKPEISNSIKERVSSQSYKILETAPIFLALTHNWWQWLYLNNQYYASVSSFLVSANFLMWLLLLVGGVGISLLTLKKCVDKRFAYASFIILAINLILFLVPKR